MGASNGARREPIAIVGLSGRFPGGANSLNLLWARLKAGIDMVGEWPAGRWDPAFFHPDKDRAGRVYTRAGGFLDQIDQFDADFFGFSPREVTQMDPQQRLLLELSWEALEDGGHLPRQLAGTRTGVFIGVSSNDYGALQHDNSSSINAYTNSGGALSIAANRLSYFYDLKGPSMALDTACSSALVAVHQACRSLWAGESTQALAGGVNMLVKPTPFVGFCKASMLSPAGRCRSFDASGDGYVRAEGGAVLLLKPLRDAERDRDRILGLIVATGVNSDGRTRGLSLPSEAAQEALLRQVYEEAAIAPERVFYVEAHGTGTSVGDPIECNAIGRVFGARRANGRPCYIGSIKSNIGHLEPASGSAGIAKVLLALKHREIPANLHFTTPNPKIRFEELNLRVVTDPIPLPQSAEPLLMGVNSFGFGGTNAHVVMQEYIPGQNESAACNHSARVLEIRSEESPKPHVLLLSARSEQALRAMASDYALFLRQPQAPSLAAICATAATRRTRHEHRLGVLGATADEIAMRLERFGAGETSAGLASVNSTRGTSRLAFVFCGNGPQWWGMGRELLEQTSLFRAVVTEIDEEFERLAGWSIRAEMALPQESSRIARTEVAQPLLFALQAGIAELLREGGLRPAATAGHSVGEIAAAYVAGALKLTDAVRVVFERSRAQGTTAGLGKMAAVGVGAEQLRPFLNGLEDRLEIAAINSPRSVTVAGNPRALDQLGERLAPEKVFFKVLPLDYAFHSYVMDPIQGILLDGLRDLKPGQESIPFVSTVTGAAFPGQGLDSRYWWRNLRDPVQFSAAIETLVAQGIELFIEIGPHPVLRDYIGQISAAIEKPAVAITTLRRPSAGQTESDLEAISTAICSCHAHGAGPAPDTKAEPVSPVELPAYPWQRQSFWNGEVGSPDGGVRTGRRDHPLLGYRLPAADPSWEGAPDTALLPYLRDHVVQGAIVFPAAGYIEMAAAAARLIFGDGPCEVEDFDIRKALVIPEGKSVATQCILDHEQGLFRISSRTDRTDAEWTLHAVGRLGRVTAPAPRAVALDQLRARLTERIDKATHYKAAAARGLAYGPAFQGIESLWVGDDEVLGEVGFPAEVAKDLEGYQVHPALLDACLQALIGLVCRDPDSTGAYLPVALKRFRLYADTRAFRFCRVRVDSRQPRSLAASFQLLASDGAVLAEIDRMRFQAVDFERATEVSTYHYEWQLGRTHREVRLADQMAPDPGTVAKAARPAIARLIDEMDRRDFYATTQLQLDGLAAAYALRALRDLGADSNPFSPETLMEGGAILPEHRRLLGRLCRIAEEDGLLVKAGDGWGLVDELTVADPEALWRTLMRERPDHIAELVLMHRCGMNQAAIMRGEVNPLKLLFPEKGSGTIEHLYDAGPSFRTYNRIAAAAITEIIARWPSHRPLRVLEIGGGTGGLTSSILPLFPVQRTTYLFTDVSEAFLGRAQARFAGYRFVECKTLDLEKELSEQDFHPESFDLILGADVVHVAADLREALGRIRSLLAPGGLMLLIEKHQERLTDIIFGVLKGWWNFRDHDLRPDSALLSPGAWQDVLKQAGFAEPVILSDADALEGPERMTQHSVLLARKAGESLGTGAADNAESDGRRRSWLLLSDEDGPGNALSSTLLGSLAAIGHDVVRVNVNGAYSRSGPDKFSVGTRDPHDLLKVIETLQAEQREFDEVVHLSGLAATDHNSAAELLDVQDRRCLSTLHLVQALNRSARSKTPRLTLVTAGSHPAPLASGKPAPVQAPLWGLGRVVMNEHPELKCRLIDLHISPDTPEACSHLLAELQTPDDESEVLLANTGRYVHRVKPTTAAQQATLSGSRADVRRNESAPGFRLGLEAYGNLESFQLTKLERVAPGPGQLEIRVRAAGLNFRDVMLAMGLLPDEAFENGFSGPTLGLECAGEVERVGPEVTEFGVGDRVIAFGSSCFASHVITSAQAVARIPDGLSFDAAATIPTTFFTAYYALKHLARLEAGERSLIHGAAGGVGLAAIQIARLLGAEIFGTAGTDEKREVLKALGVEHVLNSRSLAFVDEIHTITGGKGVDVVLNSLAGDAMWKSISVLRPLGRFIELGKRDYVANTRIGLRPFRNNLSYFGVDADQLLLHAPELTKTLLNEILELFVHGKLSPLPHRVFTMDRSSEAFRLMQQSRHIGKIVLTTELPSHHAQPRSKDFQIRSDATYLVTGGLTGLGLATAQWLVKKGARHLALLGRRGANTPEAAEGIAAMEAAGASVRAFAVDVTDESTLNGVMQEIKRDMPSIRGVIHAAMVLDDGIILQLDRERLHRVLGPKIVGAWMLHQLTLDQPLDFFVLYSSGTTLFGNPGQANYVAGCMFLEALAEHRRALGLPGLAISWGAIADVGYIARNAGVAQMITNRTGVKLIAPRQAMATLESLLAADATRVAAVNLDWKRWRQSLASAGSPKFAAVAGSQANGETQAVSVDFRETLKTLSPPERLPAMVRRVSYLIGRVMGMAAAQLDVTRPLDQLGIDSLMTVEIGSLLEEDLGFKVPAMALMDGSVTDLARKLLEMAGAEAAGQTVASTPQVASASPSIAANGHSPGVRLSANHIGKIKLITIPYIGGGSRAFSSWAGQLGGRVELVPMRIPGYEGSPEQLHKDMETLVEHLGRELLPQLDRPYALYGHSLGALIAFELARWLRQAGAEQIQHLFVAAYAAPRLKNPLARYLEGWPEDIMDRVSSTSVWAQQLQPLVPSAILDDPVRFRKALPVVKAGLSIVARYQYAPQAPLGCPITGFAGTHDQVFLSESLEAWALETTDAFELVVLPGEHLFMRDQSDAITAEIRRKLGLSSQQLVEAYA